MFIFVCILIETIDILFTASHSSFMEHPAESLISSHQNFDIYLRFTHHEMQIILMSILSNQLYQLKLTNQSMEAEGKTMFFQNHRDVFEHFKDNIDQKKQMVIVNDTGLIKAFVEIQRKGKQIKFEQKFQTTKITNELEKLKLSFLIINLLKQNKKIEPAKIENKIYVYKKFMFSVFKETKKGYFKVENNQYIERVSDGLVKYNLLSNYPIEYYGKEKQSSSSSSSFSFKIKYSKANEIEIGVVQLDSNPQQLKPFTEICFRLNTGQIRSSNGNYSEDNTYWHGGGVAVTQRKSFVIRMILDKKQKLITWLCNQMIIGVAVFNNQSMRRSLYPFIMMERNGDKIILNSESMII